MQIFGFRSATNVISLYRSQCQPRKKKEEETCLVKSMNFISNRSVDGVHKLKLRAKLFSLGFDSTKCLPNRYSAHKFDANVPRFVALSRTKFLALEIC